MATFKRGRKFTDDEVENMAEGNFDTELVIVEDTIDKWERCGQVGDLRDRFDVNFWDTDIVVYDVELSSD